MDDLIGILFYLAIIVIGGLISAYRAKSKKKMMTNAPVKPQENPKVDEIPASGFDPFEDLTKGFEFNVDEPPENSETEPDITVQSDVVSLETVAEAPEEEGMPVFEETREVMLSDAEPADEIPDYNQIASSQISDVDTIDEIQEQSHINLADNIKQGIIYYEILKRKHF